MTDVNRMFDSFLEADTKRLTKIDFQEKLRIFRENAREKCGGCYHWMKTSECKYEPKSPRSCNDVKCDDYTPNRMNLLSKAILSRLEKDGLENFDTSKTVADYYHDHNN